MVPPPTGAALHRFWARAADGNANIAKAIAPDAVPARNIEYEKTEIRKPDLSTELFILYLFSIKKLPMNKQTM
jgi:hypothetical protein